MIDPSKISIVAADDDEEMLFGLESLLKKEGFNVITASNGEDAFKLIEEENPDLVLLDVMMPKLTGVQIAKKVKSDPVLRFIPVVLVTSKDSIDDILKGFEAGANDYVRKPYRPEELKARIHAALRTKSIYRELKESHTLNQQLIQQSSDRSQFSNIIGKSASIREVFSLIEKVSDSHVPVLVTGESGTGKELVSRALHYNSPRKNKAFIVQNCSAFNENLLESELFGHVKGSFTGAVKDKDGLFKAADGGTFFLDELGEMSPALQVKLLRVLQDGTFTPVGSTQQEKVDVRIVAATNRDLKKMVTEGSFREDLYYRLNVVNITLPALRERRVDIPLLVEYFLSQHNKKYGSEKKNIQQSVMIALANYDWPGNIRELENEIERMMVMSGDTNEISEVHLSKHILQNAPNASTGKRLQGNLKDAIENLEKNMILAALERLDWNKSEAARELGISRSSLIAKVQQYNLEC
ncbi:MAG: sigma-54-dependent Fis family transcriptional regulator [Bdellovibrionales bacterium]|nr:sigma-54-dependent Fis family transcriptional regulator [Bdellovibrionales bacterium]